jgi:hypothetical protein
LKRLAATTRTDALDVMLHATEDDLWADWKHEVGEFGCAEHVPGGGWTVMTPVSWSDSSWVDVEGTRKAILGQVVGN